MSDTREIRVGRKGHAVLHALERLERPGRRLTEFSVQQESGLEPRRFHHVVGYLSYHGYVTRNPFALTDKGRAELER